MNITFISGLKALAWVINIFLCAFFVMGFVMGYTNPLTTLFALSLTYIFVHYWQRRYDKQL